jgi:KEOPS complex subunit Cgi121
MDSHDISCEIRTALFDVADRDRFLHAVRAIASDHGTAVICFNADNLAGKRHAEIALRHALRSQKAGTLIANSFEMEALLYASGSRQCSVASAFGVRAGKNRAYICSCPARAGVWEALAPLVRFVDGDWDTITPEHRAKLKELFAIPDEEIAAAGESRFTDLVLERVALLEVYR